ncbi:uncharacterized protein EI90DRAFT_3033767 [Cantharellus anzutake]|uniref:uncharacterized protein n=1 Tax=Cantharellus anzutake TaxID=1750568 RepID=UPI0019055F44|nr:uncharacterized protein EI90DRAFT_3033767 [Cantharellus anzutake]KAF8341379.1 hypothetical protein EI90DRAFT_3033767 [Cantharellus anzutake]
MKEGMDILSEHVSRVGSLTIDAATDTQLGLLATFLESCEAQWIARGQTQPTLRRLKLIDSADSDYDSGSDSDSDSEDIITPNINQKRLSPNNLQTLRGLEDVVLSGTSLPWHSPVFEGLKRLSLENLQNEVLPSEREFISIIRNCPLLEELELANAGLRLEKWEGIAEMRRRTHSSDLNRLESLCLFQLPWNVMMFILHLVNSPNLKSLWIALPTAIRDQDSIVDHDEEIFRDVHLLKSIAAFIDRISEKSALRTLHIGSFYGTSVWDDGKHTNPHLMEVLRAVPSCLHTLELYHIVVGDDVLESLSAIAPTPSAPSNPHTGAHSVSASISSIVSVPLRFLPSQHRLHSCTRRSSRFVHRSKFSSFYGLLMLPRKIWKNVRLMS